MTLILIVPYCSFRISAWVRNQATTNASSLVGLADGVGSFVTRYPVADFAVCRITRTGTEEARAIIGTNSLQCRVPAVIGTPASAHQNSILAHGDAPNDR